MVHAVEDVSETELNETERGLVPSWIEYDTARVTGILVETFAP